MDIGCTAEEHNIAILDGVFGVSLSECYRLCFQPGEPDWNRCKLALALFLCAHAIPCASVLTFEFGIRICTIRDDTLYSISDLEGRPERIHAASLSRGVQIFCAWPCVAMELLIYGSTCY